MKKAAVNSVGGETEKKNGEKEKLLAWEEN